MSDVKTKLNDFAKILKNVHDELGTIVVPDLRKNLPELREVCHKINWLDTLKLRMQGPLGIKLP
jgi:hypothetical protein